MSELLRIAVRSLTGKTINVAVNGSDFCHTIKEKIQESDGIPPDQMRLIFAGKVLECDVSAIFFVDSV